MKRPIDLNFTRTRARVSWPGALFLAIGLSAAGTVLFEYRALIEQRAGLEMRLSALARAASPRSPEEGAALDARGALSAEQAASELATPWTRLLAELEQASKDSEGEVALLGVEPDHAKHSVRISAEARTLSLALSYVKRLQSSRSLQYPMLDRHEVRADDTQHPVRFELTGTWRDTP